MFVVLCEQMNPKIYNFHKVQMLKLQGNFAAKKRHIRFIVYKLINIINTEPNKMAKKNKTASRVF